MRAEGECYGYIFESALRGDPGPRRRCSEPSQHHTIKGSPGVRQGLAPPPTLGTRRKLMPYEDIPAGHPGFPLLTVGQLCPRSCLSATASCNHGNELHLAWRTWDRSHRQSVIHPGMPGIPARACCEHPGSHTNIGSPGVRQEDEMCEFAAPAVFVESLRSRGSRGS